MFKWLTGKDIQKPNFKVSEPHKVDNKIRGTFEYQCRVSCAAMKSEYYFTVTTYDDKTQPVVKCPCGRKVKLMDAPLETERLIMGKVHKSRRNSMMRIDCGDGHSVHMGSTFRHEIDK